MTGRGGYPLRARLSLFHQLGVGCSSGLRCRNHTEPATYLNIRPLSRQGVPFIVTQSAPLLILLDDEAFPAGLRTA